MAENGCGSKFVDDVEILPENGDTIEAKKRTVALQENAGVIERLKHDAAYRSNCVYSMFIALAFVSLGMYIGQHGSTILDIQIITDTDLEQSSALFTSGNCGYMVGAIVTGLVYNKVNRYLLLCASTLFLGLTNILLPFCRSFETMMVVRFLSSSFGAGIDTGGNAEHMRIWGSSADGLMQFLHFCFSFGGLMSPLFAEPFLAEKVTTDMNSTAVNGSLHSITNSSDSGEPVVLELETRVEYVFIITGVFVTSTSVPFLVFYLKEHQKKRKNKVEKHHQPSQRDIPFPWIVAMLLCVCSYYFVYCCVEDTFFSFLMAFVVKEYDSVSKSQGVFTTAISWAAFAVARFLMIFMTRLFSPFRLLLLMTTTMAVAFTCFTALAHYGIVDALVVFAALAAISMSGVFPAGFSWMEAEMFRVTGVISSCILVASSMGAMLNPLVLTFLMEEYDNMWFCYLLVLQTFLLCAILLMMTVLTRCCVASRYGPMSAASDSETTYSTDHYEENGDGGGIGGDGLVVIEDEDLNETKVTFLPTKN